MGPNSILLMHAQKAAFGGGNLAAEPASIRGAETIPQQRLYQEHYERLGDLYREMTTWSQAAVGFFGSDDPKDAAEYQAKAHAAYDVLLGLHVATDIVTPGVCTLEKLSRYELVVLPDLRFLTDEHLDALRIFHAGGRRLLVFGDREDCTGQVRETSENPLARLSEGPLDPEIIRRTVADMTDEIRPLLHLPASVDRKHAVAIKAAAWVDDPAGPSRVIVHLVNFNVDPEADEYRVARVKAGLVTVPFPDSDTTCRVIRVDDRREERVSAVVDDDHVRTEVTDLGIHTIVVFKRDHPGDDAIG